MKNTFKRYTVQAKYLFYRVTVNNPRVLMGVRNMLPNQGGGGEPLTPKARTKVFAIFYALDTFPKFLLSIRAMKFGAFPKKLHTTSILNLARGGGT